MNLAQIILILQLSLSLLVSVSNNPTASPTQKQQALEFAKQAISISTQAIQGLQATSSQDLTGSPPPPSTPPQNPQAPQIPHLVVDISSDKGSVKNDGIDYATLTIKVSLSNGQVVTDKVVKISEDLDPIIKQSCSATQTSCGGSVVYLLPNSDGVVEYKTAPRAWFRVPAGCGGGFPGIHITVEVEGGIYTKSIGITDIHPSGGPQYGPPCAQA